jgi:hypothetical protein
VETRAPEELYTALRSAHVQSEAALDALEQALSHARAIEAAVPPDLTPQAEELVEFLDGIGYLLVEERPEIPPFEEFQENGDYRENLLRQAREAMEDSLHEMRMAREMAGSLRSPIPAEHRGKLGSVEATLAVAIRELEIALRAL